MQYEKLSDETKQIIDKATKLFGRTRHEIIYSFPPNISEVELQKQLKDKVEVSPKRGSVKWPGGRNP